MAGAIDVKNLSSVEVRALQTEYLRRHRSKEARKAKYKPTPRELGIAEELKGKWFEKQANFFNSPSRRRVAFCTRRAGKTIGIAIWFLASMLENPTSLHLYLAQTSGAAKLYLWPELKRLIEEYALPFKTNETDLTIQHKRGLGMLVLKGADKEDEIEKLRGPKWLKVALDEAATFGAYMENLITEVLGAALRDQMGHLIMAGTAGKVKAGIFYEACHGLRKRKSDGLPVYELHQWSLQDNPYLPDDAKNEDLIIDDEGFSGTDDPRFLREFRGIWAVGESERMFAGFTEEKNTYDGALPSGHDFRFLLGCDFGWNDESAMSTIAYSPTCPTVFVEECWGAKRQYTDDIAAKMLEYKSTYGVRRFVGDTGGYGKNVVVHLARDYHIHVEHAQKREKLDHIAFINSAFQRGDIKIHRIKAARLIKQLQEVSWNENRTDAGNHERDDLCFSFVYGWRAAKSSGAGLRSLPSNSANTNPLRQHAVREKLNALRKPQRTDKHSWINKLAGVDSGHPSGSREWCDMLGVGRR